jgi:hypothetical protein
MTNWLASLTLILALLLAGAGLSIKSQYDSIRDLRIENKSLTEVVNRAIERSKQDRKVLVARENKIALQAQNLAVTQRALSEALQANKAWSDTYVPDDVQKALGGAPSGLPDRL